MRIDSGKYTVKIGLEVHAQLNTKTKLFSAEPFEKNASPNSKISSYTAGYPGTLPVLNDSAVKKAIKTGLAFNCDVQTYSEFSRKNYFYPDLPKGYQITQHEYPLCKNGELIYFNEKEEFAALPLQQIHLEEDSGKIIHAGKKLLIDLNRAGAALVEIVTMPAIQTPKNARLAVAEIRKILKYIDVSEGKMEKGELRCDANISVSEFDSMAANKVEIKNLNSLRNIEKALKYEIQRQIQLLKAGKKTQNETRSFNEKTNQTYRTRSKQNQLQYRYMPEPDLPPLKIEEQYIRYVYSTIDQLPINFYQLFKNQMNLSVENINILTEEKYLAKLFLHTTEKGASVKTAASLFAGPIAKYFKNKKILKITQTENLAILCNKIDAGEIDFSIAKEMFLPKFFDHKHSSNDFWKNNCALEYAMSETELNVLIKKIVEQDIAKIKQYKSGKKGLIGFFMGKIIKELKQPLNKSYLNELLKIQLDKWDVK